MAILRRLALGPLALLSCATLLLTAPRALAQGGREYDIKAAMVFNFAQFVQWPTNALASTNSPFVIGILGADPFGRTIDQLTAGETIQGRPMVVRRLNTIEETVHCHILFVSQSEANNWSRVRGYLNNAPVLTVSDLDRFARRGGMIRLMMDQNRVKFRINRAAAKEAGLELSSKLLRLAELAETTED